MRRSLHPQLGGRLLDRLTNHFLDYNLSVQVSLPPCHAARVTSQLLVKV